MKDRTYTVLSMLKPNCRGILPWPRLVNCQINWDVTGLLQ